MSKELSFLIKTVKDASKLITDEFEVRDKSNDGDLVTTYDFEIEQFIINEINKEYSGFSVVSEELNTDKELSDNCFVIDPIDGTVNFAYGIPLWGIQVACVKDGKTCAAVIYEPKFDDLYYADDNGAFLNGKKISVNDLGVNKGLYAIEGPGKKVRNYKIKNTSRTYRDFHSAAFSFAYVACGKLSAVNFTGNSYWDYLPGQYIALKAGAVIYDDSENHIAANNEEFLNALLNDR